MTEFTRFKALICVGALVLFALAQQASAQRVRFGSSSDEGRISLADRTMSSPDSPSGTTVPPVYIADSVMQPPSVSYASPSTTQYVAANWDPYRTAQRPAFTGTITSTPGQYLLPQPMPRVPYYTQQPVAAANAPIVVVPEPTCSAPVAQPAVTQPFFPTSVQPGPIVAPTVPVPVAIPVIAPAPIISTPQCYAAADAIFMTRDAQIGNQPLVLLNGNAPTQSNVLLSTADLSFPFEVGPRVILGREFDQFRAIEGEYFGIYNWQAKGTRTGNNNLNLPDALGLVGALDFFNADTMTVEYDSIIHNGEINYIQTYGDLSWLIGFRYFNLQDKFSITSTDVMTGTSAYRISVYNNLFGGQLGGKISQACNNWSYDLIGKAGVYGNDIFTSQNVGDFNGFTLRQTKENAGQLAFLGDLEINGNYQFTPNWFLRGGYQVMWVEGLALAPNQLDFTNTMTSGTHVDKNGSLFMQGAHAGLMARW